MRAGACVSGIWVGKSRSHRLGKLVKTSQVVKLSVTPRSRVTASGGGVDHWGYSPALFPPIFLISYVCRDVPTKPSNLGSCFFHLSAICPHGGDPTDPQSWQRTRKQCFLFFFFSKILSSTCQAQLTYCFSSESFCSPPTRTCCDLSLPETRKPSALEWFAGTSDLSTLSLIRATHLGKLPPSDD